MPWRGRFIEVDETATGKPVWSWRRCCACGKDLYRGRDITEGFHARCRARVTEAKAEQLRTEARAEDRRQWRLDHPAR